MHEPLTLVEFPLCKRNTALLAEQRGRGFWNVPLLKNRSCFLHVTLSSHSSSKEHTTACIARAVPVGPLPCTAAIYFTVLLPFAEDFVNSIAHVPENERIWSNRS